MVARAEIKVEVREISLAFVIPTKDRGEDLRRMLGSLVNQTRLPDQVIVVDGGGVVVPQCWPILKTRRRSERP